MSKSGIYQIRHRDSGARYIGSAISLSGRKATHRSALRKGSHYNPVLQNAWNKYGEDAFIFEDVIIGLSQSELLREEQVIRMTLKTPTLQRSNGSVGRVVERE